MITQPLFDFSKVVLSRKRRPYFRASRQCWYFKDANGKQYRLHSDEQRAFEIWRSIVGPEPEPVVVPGIVREPQPARPKYRFLSHLSRYQLRSQSQPGRSESERMSVLMPHAENVSAGQVDGR